MRKNTEIHLTLTCHASNKGYEEPQPELLTIPENFAIKFYTRRNKCLLVSEAEQIWEKLKKDQPTTGHYVETYTDH